MLLFQPVIGAKTYTQTFVFRSLYFCMVINKRFYNLYIVVWYYHGAFWLNHRMMAILSMMCVGMGEWGSCASSIFVGS